MISVRPLQSVDKPAWLGLAQGYKAFYNTTVSDAEYEATWLKLLDDKSVHCIVAELDGQVVGIAHYLFHQTTWAPCVCYLQDLFVPAEQRGKGIARALIEAVADCARKAGADRYYWNTKADNLTARALYDKVAENRGFIRYDYLM
jgi:GNAT superfamily N-acetyltransferase